MVTKPNVCVPDNEVNKWQIFLKIPWNPIFTRSFVHARTYVDFSQISKKDVVLELCSGTGIITIELAKRAKHVYAVEKEHLYVQRVKKALKKIGINNISFLFGDISKRTYMDKLREKIGKELSVIVSNPDFSILEAVLSESWRYKKPSNIIMPVSIIKNDWRSIKNKALQKACLFLSDHPHSITKKEFLSEKNDNKANAIVSLRWS